MDKRSIVRNKESRCEKGEGKEEGWAKESESKSLIIHVKNIHKRKV